MGYVRYEDTEKFIVKLEGPEDKAALNAALKATPGTDEGEPTSNTDTLAFDSDNPSNAVAFWAAEFDWENRAMKVALDQIVPLAWQQIGIHSGTLLRSLRKKGGFPDLAELAKRMKSEGENKQEQPPTQN